MSRQGLPKRDTSWPLQQAFKARLDTLNLMSIGAVPRPCPVLDFGGVKKLTPFPYVTVGDETTERSMDNKSAVGDSVTVQVHIWSQYQGAKEVAIIGDAIEQGLTYAPLELSGYQMKVNLLRREFAQTLKEMDGITIHRVLRFRVWVDDLTPHPNP